MPVKNLAERTPRKSWSVLVETDYYASHSLMITLIYANYYIKNKYYLAQQMHITYFCV